MKKILIVDDEKEVRDLLKDSLVLNNFEVITASAGEEALAVCKDTMVDLILLDIAMPQMDGYQTAEKLRKEKNAKNAPILFLTGKDLDVHGIIQRCNAIGACGYISKLSTLNDFIEKIREFI